VLLKYGRHLHPVADMLYLANPSTQNIRNKMSDGTLGYIATPTSTHKNQRVEGAKWCADNGCFGKKYDETKWWAWLQLQVKWLDSCLFATAPDVVGDAESTLRLGEIWLPKIRALGYPAALVAQDGLENMDVPWDSFDCLFVGGTTEWKLGEGVRVLTAEAKRRGKWVHIGRVNSNRRFRYSAYELQADSCDGTFLIFGPDVNLPKLLKWVDGITLKQLTLFD